MYSREKVELFLLATEDGMGPTAAAEFAGVTVSAAKKWATGHLPRSYTGGGCRIVARKPPRKEASLGPDKSIYAPPATGPLAGLNEDQIENLLLRAVSVNIIFTISTNAFSPIAPTRIRRIRQRGCAAFGA